MPVSFLCKELLPCGAVLSTFELAQALNRYGVDAYIVSAYNNPEYERFFQVEVKREPVGTTVAVSPRCEGEWAYVRTRDERWLQHESRKIVVSGYLRDWLGDGVIIGNGTHERFFNQHIDRDIDVLVTGNYEANKNMEATLERAKSIGGRVVWFGRSVVPSAGIETVENPGLLEIPRLYNRAKCFLTMSRNEGWGRPVAEAMACGVPDVINENGGNRDIEVVEWEQIAKQFISTLWP